MGFSLKSMVRRVRENSASKESQEVLALFVLVAGFLAVLYATLVVVLALLLLVVASSRKMMQTLQHTAKRWQTSRASQYDTTAPY